ncbi:hypothetical protein AB0M54_19315 [Actinoplanes sp. NPDC051470]|uniref:hypothetical protein n=1 Tax=Actinoplanes sp. NPDC051470 TaxID=3157224 RepID=UPI003416B009
MAQGLFEGQQPRRQIGLTGESGVTVTDPHGGLEEEPVHRSLPVEHSPDGRVGVAMTDPVGQILHHPQGWIAVVSAVFPQPEP